MGTERSKGMGDPRHVAADGGEHSSELPGEQRKFPMKAMAPFRETLT